MPGRAACFLAALFDLVVLTSRSVCSPRLSLHTFRFPAVQNDTWSSWGLQRQVPRGPAGNMYKSGEDRQWILEIRAHQKGMTDTQPWPNVAPQEGDLSFAKYCDFFRMSRKLGFFGESCCLQHWQQIFFLSLQGKQNGVRHLLLLV